MRPPFTSFDLSGNKPGKGDGNHERTRIQTLHRLNSHMSQGKGVDLRRGCEVGNCTVHTRMSDIVVGGEDALNLLPKTVKAMGKGGKYSEAAIPPIIHCEVTKFAPVVVGVETSAGSVLSILAAMLPQPLLDTPNAATSGGGCPLTSGVWRAQSFLGWPLTLEASHLILCIISP